MDNLRKRTQERSSVLTVPSVVIQAAKEPTLSSPANTVMLVMARVVSKSLMDLNAIVPPAIWYLIVVSLYLTFLCTVICLYHNFLVFVLLASIICKDFSALFASFT